MMILDKCPAMFDAAFYGNFGSFVRLTSVIIVNHPGHDSKLEHMFRQNILHDFICKCIRSDLTLLGFVDGETAELSDTECSIQKRLPELMQFHKQIPFELDRVRPISFASRYPAIGDIQVVDREDVFCPNRFCQLVVVLRIDHTNGELLVCVEEALGFFHFVFSIQILEPLLEFLVIAHRVDDSTQPVTAAQVETFVKVDSHIKWMHCALVGHSKSPFLKSKANPGVASRCCPVLYSTPMTRHTAQNRSHMVR